MRNSNLLASMTWSLAALASHPSLAFGGEKEVLAVFGTVGHYDSLGQSVGNVGDVNGDGLSDFIAGAYQAEIGKGVGYARVYSGANGQILRTVLGSGVDEDFGWSVSGAGDVNADGVPDFIVGAPEDDDNGFGSGSARVFSGASGAVLYTFLGDAVDDNFGLSVSGAGDVNQDGYADVIVGATVDFYPVQAPDYARVFSGKTGAVLYTLFGEQGQADKFGYSVAGAGDVDGDGFDDVLVGAPFASFRGITFHGAVYVFSGRNGHRIRRLAGDADREFLGYSVAAVGDITGDGASEIASGAWSDDAHGQGAGSIRIWSGGEGTLLYRHFGNVGEGLGTAVAGGGDVDGDGVPDILGGAYDSGKGTVRVYSGSNGSVLHKFRSWQSYGFFGRSLCAIEDLTGDGQAEVVIGGPGDGTYAPGAGSARLYSLTPGPWAPATPRAR